MVNLQDVEVDAAVEDSGCLYQLKQVLNALCDEPSISFLYISSGTKLPFTYIQEGNWSNELPYIVRL